MSDYDIQGRIQQDYDALLRILPFDIREVVTPVIAHAEEIKLRFGLPLKIRHGGHWHKYPQVVIDQRHLTDFRARIDHLRDDNRAGIDGTGHRVSAVPSADARGIDGFNIRVARFYGGVAEALRARLFEHPSLLIMGKAGKGKSTLLRDVVRIVAEKYDANLTVVDTSNEVAGDGRVPHPGIGEADRYFVPIKARQHEVMLEAIANNSAHILAIDEVQREHEAQMIRDLSVKAAFIATTHGDDIEQILGNHALAALFRPTPVFYWGLVVSDIGVYHLYRLSEVIQALEQGTPPQAVEHFRVRMREPFPDHSALKATLQMRR